MSLLTKRIIEDVEESQATRPAPIKLAHDLLDKATLLVINTTARLSPLTHRLPGPFRDAVHGIPVSLLEWSSSVRANYARGRDMPSLEDLRALALSMRKDSLPTAISSIEPHKLLAEDELGYNWHIFVENAVALQFHLIYCDNVNSVWEVFRERWTAKYITNGDYGKKLALEGSLAMAISEAAMGSVMMAACASEGFLRQQRRLAAKGPGERELLEILKDIYGAPNIVAAWADELPDGLVEAVYGSPT